MELVNSLFNFFTDTTKKLSHKASFIILGITILVFLDNSLSFTYHYNNFNKLTQVEKVNEIIKDTTLTSYEIEKLKEIRSIAINHKTWKDKIYEKVLSIEFSPQKTSFEDTSDLYNSKSTSVERKYWLHFISSSWSFFVLIIIIPFIGFADKENSLSVNLVTILFFILFLLGASWIYAKVLSYIPIILNTPTYNYIINAIINALTFPTAAYFINKSEKKKKN